MKKLLKTALVAIPAAALIGVSSNAVSDSYDRFDGHGQGDHKSKRGYGRYGGSMNGEMGQRIQKKMVRKLDLTDAQAASLAEIFARQNFDMTGQREAGRAMYEKLTTLEPGSDAYNAQVDMIAQSRATNMAMVMKAWGKTQADIMVMLNDEQKTEFQEMFDHLGKRMKGRG